ncbi:hypothetical protein M0R89_21455 (plasmid) [Halorussus limi]|uniref:Uncharacterized protein n=1 Tax=Halorussus limi TaxID=2938695 RepID=A0A8U0I149_9EURY|nr:hypothetical protein [Halorussus limi]UPV76763.1 hypothetical protein M0R89_21455 [Halorussus limi]
MDTDTEIGEVQSIEQLDDGTIILEGESEALGFRITDEDLQESLIKAVQNTDPY